MAPSSAIGSFVIGESAIGTPANTYQQPDFLAALQALLPRGRVWPRDLDATLTAVLNGLAASLTAQSTRALYLLTDAFPVAPIELLPDWQQTLGLPDSNGPAPPDRATAQRQVAAKFANNSAGQNVAAFQAYATALGFSITVENHAPFRCGQSSCGAHLGADEWFNGWTIHGPAGLASSQGLFTEIAPGHSTLLFNLS